MTVRFEIAADTQDLCGEAPLWIPERRTIVWCDQGRGIVRQLAPTGPQVLFQGFSAGGAVLATDGKVVLIGPDGVATLGADNTCVSLPLEPLPQGSCLNDGCAGPQGELFAGVMSLSSTCRNVARPGQLVRLFPNGTRLVLDDDIVLPNGMGLSPDFDRLYVVDSVRRQLLSYGVSALERGRSERQVLVTLEAKEGFPDGMAVDAEGGIWLALWYTGQLIRVTSEGKIDAKIRLPFAQVSSLAFGGDDGLSQHVTSAQFPWQSDFVPSSCADSQAQGGALLRLRPGVRGAPMSEVNLGMI